MTAYALRNEMEFDEFMEKEIKRLPISQKRQVTIPKKFFEQLNLGREVECYVEKGALILKPVIKGIGDFSEYILRDLISEGLQGQELLDAFIVQQTRLREATKAMLNDARKYAENYNESDVAKAKSLFDETGD